jgi:FkbM family methyltransferase
MIQTWLRPLRQRIVRWMMSRGPSNKVTFQVLKIACRLQGSELLAYPAYMALRNGNREMRLAPHHFAYCVDMSSRFDIYYSIVEPHEADGYQVVDYSSPRLQRYRESGMEFELASFPEEQEVIDDYFRWYTPGAGDIVFDIGAHCGVSSYEFSRRVGPDGQVFALEPDPINFALLQRNIQRHSLTNVTALQLALSDSNGTASFNAEGTIGSGLVHVFDRPTTGTCIEVETVTLEELCSRCGIPTFCKIDIEGAEIEVLRQAGSLLSRTPMHLVLDTHHFVRGRQTTAETEHLLQQAGYGSFSSAESGTTTTWARPAGFGGEAS